MARWRRRAKPESAALCCPYSGEQASVTASTTAAHGRIRESRTPGARLESRSASSSGRSAAGGTFAPRKDTMNSSAISRNASGKKARPLRASEAAMPVSSRHSSTVTAREYAASASGCPPRNRMSALAMEDQRPA